MWSLISFLNMRQSLTRTLNQSHNRYIFSIPKHPKINPFLTCLSSKVHSAKEPPIPSKIKLGPNALVSAHYSSFWFRSIVKEIGNAPMSPQVSPALWEALKVSSVRTHVHVAEAPTGYHLFLKSYSPGTSIATRPPSGTTVWYLPRYEPMSRTGPLN